MTTIARWRSGATAAETSTSPRATRRVVGAFITMALAFNVAACASDAELGSSQEALTSGSWQLPDDVRAAGAQVRVRYDDAPSWTGRCPTDGLTAGGQALGEFLRNQFPAISSVGGFSCRQNTANASKTSVHGTGRALDIMVPESSAEGEEIANYLVLHAQEIGIQLLIWNHTVWRANGSNEKRYTGPNPHTDHVHAEINEDAANQQTPFFSNGISAPTPGGLTPQQPTPGGVIPQQPIDPITGQPMADGFDPYNPNPGAYPGSPYPTNPYPGNPYPSNPYPTDPYGQQPVDPSRPGSIPTAPNGVPSTPGGGVPTSPGGTTLPGTGTTVPAPTTVPTTPVTTPPDTNIADTPSGAADSLGKGVREPTTKKKSKAKPQVESGCAAAPGSTSSNTNLSSFGTIMLALGAVIGRRRRKG